ncbi:hypothetical protein BV327_05354 [Pseudomonas syringae pv. actinidiae]|nr:hypothetical protein BV327_05354 [Pseudomonas syringae pv. actinidiae]
MQSFRHGHGQQIVAVAVVAAVADMRVDLLEESIGGHACVEQYEGIGTAWSTRRAVFKIHAVSGNPRKPGDDRPVHRIGVPLVDRRKLVAHAQTQLVVMLGIRARRLQPVGIVDHLDNARYRLRQHRVVTRCQVVAAARSHGLDRHDQLALALFKAARLGGYQLVDMTVESRRLDDSADRHFQLATGIGAGKEQFTNGHRRGLALDVHRPGQHVQPMRAGSLNEEIRQHRAADELQQPQHRPGDQRRDDPPERTVRAGVGQRAALLDGQFFPGLFELRLGSRNAGITQRLFEVDGHRVISTWPNFTVVAVTRYTPGWVCSICAVPGTRRSSSSTSSSIC